MYQCSVPVGDTRTDFAVYRARSGQWLSLFRVPGFTDRRGVTMGTSFAVSVMVPHRSTAAGDFRPLTFGLTVQHPAP